MCSEVNDLPVIGIVGTYDQLGALAGRYKRRRCWIFHKRGAERAHAERLSFLQCGCEVGPSRA